MKPRKSEFQITYLLRRERTDKKGLVPIYIRSRQNSTKQIPYNTHIKIHPSQWNKRKNEPKEKPVELIDLEGRIQSTYKDLLKLGLAPDLNAIIASLEKGQEDAERTIVSWCDDYLTGPYSMGQKKAVRTAKTNIESFRKDLTFDKLTKPIIKEFFGHLADRGVANNSQYKRLRALINVANHANIDCPQLFNYKLPYSTQNAMKVRLSWPEVRAIMNTEPKSQIETVAKDVFLLACFSGLRISDIMSLNRGELHEFFYERLQTKTKMPVLVTVHKYNRELFKTYIETGVPYCRQRMSDALKKVLERSGLTKEIIKVQAVGYSYKESTKKKFEEIAFHSGRRFYSRLLNDLSLGGEIARDELGHGYKSITDLYAGSPEHSYRVARVRQAMETLEEKLEQLAGIMKVA